MNQEIKVGDKVEALEYITSISESIEKGNIYTVVATAGDLIKVGEYQNYLPERYFKKVVVEVEDYAVNMMIELNKPMALLTEGTTNIKVDRAKQQTAIFKETYGHIEGAVIEGVGKDAPIVMNERGGGQSDSPYRLDLVDPKAILEMSKVLKEGADKYGERNWELISIPDHLNHLLVHVYAYLAGDKSDDHLAHAACRAVFALGVELDAKGAE